jgi:hypothetical protein
MKKLFGIGILLFAVVLPVLAQWRLSRDDQGRFDSYFSRWQDARQRNDRGGVESMERRMLDVYAHYNIPPQTPFWRVASNARDNARNDDYDHDRGYRDHDRDRDRRDRDRWRGRLSSDDQAKFDSYFTRWQNYKRTNNGSEVRSMERRMFDLMQRYGIPQQVPFDQIASR